MEIGSKGSEPLSRKIDAYQDEIDKRNYRNLKKFSLGGLVLSGIIFLVSLVLINHLSFTAEYGGFFCLFVVFSLFVHFVLKKNIKYTLLSYYVFMVSLFGIGIAMGSFFDANSSAITIMVLMCTMFLIIVDKPARLLASMGDVHPAPGVGESISLSVGCAICARESHAFDAAYKAADGALYAAKAKGKSTFNIVSA